MLTAYKLFCMQSHKLCLKMHSGAFAARMLLGFRDYNVKSPFNFVEFALSFCSSVQKERDSSSLRSVGMTLYAQGYS